MARFPYHGTTKDLNGAVVPSATVSVFLTGTSTAASIYTASSGGSAVNSVTSDSTTGAFVFYVDDGDYSTAQRFDITMSKTDFTSVTYSDIVIVSLGGVTATVAELNTLDGITADVGELNILDGVTADAGELNILDGVTADAGELNILDGVTTNATELNYVDGVTSAVQGQFDTHLADTTTHGTTGDVVGTSDSQTLSNKSLTAPTLTGAIIMSGSLAGAGWPIFSVHKDGTDQTGIATGTFTKVTWPAEAWDTNNNFASDRFTPTVAGKYLLHATALLTVGAAGAQFSLNVYRNGTIHKSDRIVSVSTVNFAAAITVIVTANGSSDYFEIYCEQQTGADKIIEGDAPHTYFLGYRIG